MEMKKTSKKQNYTLRDKINYCIFETRTGCFKNETIREHKNGLLDTKNVIVKTTNLVKEFVVDGLMAL